MCGFGKGRAAACGDPLVAIALLLGGFQPLRSVRQGVCFPSIEPDLLQVKCARDNFSSERDAWCARSTVGVW
jgi:hypothetical protein